MLIALTIVGLVTFPTKQNSLYTFKISTVLNKNLSQLFIGPHKSFPINKSRIRYLRT